MPHIHEKIDFIANVYIVNADAVLLRKHDKYKVWLAPGGHIELDEDPAEAAVREVKEEVGLDVILVSATELPQERLGDSDVDGRELPVPFFINRHRSTDTHEHISFEFFGRAESRDVTQGAGENSDDIRWFTRAMLDDASYEVPARIVFYSKRALEILGT